MAFELVCVRKKTCKATRFFARSWAKGPGPCSCGSTCWIVVREPPK